MSLLAPLFLLGGLLVALPVVLHLTRKRREPVPFPSFLLLRATAATARWKRRRFRHLPLLLLRCLALALLAAAFAQPLLEKSDAGGAASSAPTDLAVLVDRSASMAITGRIEAAREAAAREIESLDRGDRAILLSFADRATGHSELTEDFDALRSELARIEPGDGGTRVSVALGLAARLLPATRGRRREVVLISDLQRTGFEDGTPSPSLPPGVGLRVHRIGAGPPPNAGVRDVRVSAEGGEQIAVAASVGFSPGSDRASPDLDVELVVAGEVVDRQSVAIDAGRSANVRFAPIPAPSEAREAEVRVFGDAFPKDDRFRFVIPPEAALRVADFGESALHVREALAVGTAPAFAVISAPLRGESAAGSALSGVRAALVRDPGRLDTGAARALADFVRGGGGVIVALGPRRMPDAVWSELEDVLPARPGQILDRQPAGRIADFDVRHPALTPFRGEAASALSRAAFYRYRTLGELAEGADVLARFDDGRAALLSRSAGDGVALLLASSLDARWNDLPRRPAFVPLLHRLVEAAAQYERLPVAWRVGDSVEVERAFRLPRISPEADDGVLVEAPSGARSVVSADGAFRLDEAGYFRGRHPESVRREPAAANVASPETDLRVLDPEEVRLGAAARDAAPTGEGDAPAGSGERVAASFGTPLWWALLAGLAALLLAEAVAANRLTPRRPRDEPGDSYTVA